MSSSTVEYIVQLDEQAGESVRTLREVTDELEESIHPPITEEGPTRSFSNLNGETLEKQRTFLYKYESWFAAGETFVGEYLPARLDEYREGYQKVSRLAEFQHSPAELGLIETYNEISRIIDFQRRLLASIPAKLKAEQYRLRKQITKQVSKDELGKSRDLLDEELTRAAGVLAGVALERHLLRMCEESDSVSKFNHDDGIAALSQNLYDAGELDKTTLSSLKTLSSIRADCAHANQEEPNEHKVRRLIDDTDDYIRGRGI